MPHISWVTWGNMQIEADVPNIIVGFSLVLTRIGAFFTFIPLPGARAYSSMPKIVLTLAVTLMLFHNLPVDPRLALSAPSILLALAAEVTLGLATGTGVALLIEATQMTGQFIGLQAGFSYASTIDPNSEADSGILLIICQLLTSLIIFAIGLDREILAALASSFEKIPAGSFRLTTVQAIGLLSIGARMFQIGLRLALPVIAILLIADVALALLGKVEQHLQLSSLVFPLKMLSGLVILAAVLSGTTRLIEQWLWSGWRTVHQVLGF